MKEEERPFTLFYFWFIMIGGLLLMIGAVTTVFNGMYEWTWILAFGSLSTIIPLKYLAKGLSKEGEK